MICKLPLALWWFASPTSLAAVQAVNGTVTVPNVYGGSSQYQVTSTGLNQTGETTRTANVADLGDDVSTTLPACFTPLPVPCLFTDSFVSLSRFHFAWPLHPSSIPLFVWLVLYHR